MEAVISAVTMLSIVGIMWYLFSPFADKNTGQIAPSGVATPAAVGHGDGTGDDGGGGGKSI